MFYFISLFLSRFLNLLSYICFYFTGSKEFAWFDCCSALDQSEIDDDFYSVHDGMRVLSYFTICHLTIYEIELE